MRGHQQCKVESGCHQAGVRCQRHHQAQVFSGNEFPPPHRTGEDGVERFLVDLFRHQSNADQDRDHDAKQRHRAQAHIDEDETVKAD